MLVNLTILLCIFPVFIITISILFLFLLFLFLCFLAFKLHLLAVHERTVKVEEGLVTLRYLIGQYSVSNENEMLSVFVLPAVFPMTSTFIQILVLCY